MMAVLMVAPATAHSSGLPLAVTIALSVTAIVALGMVIIQLRRTSRLTPLVGGIGAASAAGILALTGLVASIVIDTTPEPASAVVSLEVTDYALENLQLETLPVD